MIAMPPLGGHAGSLVRTAYLIFFPLAVAVAISGLIFFYHVTLQIDPPTSRYGIALAVSDEFQAIVTAMDDGPLPAGLAEGDRVVAIAGAPMDRVSFSRIAAVFGTGDAAVLLDVARADGRISRHRLQRVADHAPSGQAVSLAEFERNTLIVKTIVSTFLFAVSFLLFRRRSSDPESMIFAFGFLFWAVEPAESAQWIAHALGVSVHHWHFAFRVTHAIGVTLVMVGLPGFPSGKFHNRLAMLPLLPPIAYFLFGIITGYAFVDRHTSIRAALYFVIWTIAVLPVLLRYPRLPPGIERQQIKWAAFGGASLIVCDVLRLGVGGLPWADTSLVYYVGQLLLLGESVAFPIGLLISLLRFRLYAADSVIGRSAGYGGLTLLFVALSAGFEQVAQAVGQQFFGDNLGDWASGIGAAAAAACIAPAHNRILHWTERHFQGRLLRLRDGLPRLLNDLCHTATLNVIAGTALNRIASSLGSEHGAVIRDGKLLAACEISDDDVAGWLSAHGDASRKIDKGDRIFPLRLPLVAEHGGSDGRLLLGHRPDGSAFTHEEREVLNEVADALARALSVAAERQGVEAQRVSEVNILKDHIAGLREELAQLRSSLTRPASESE